VRSKLFKKIKIRIPPSFLGDKKIDKKIYKKGAKKEFLRKSPILY